MHASTVTTDLPDELGGTHITTVPGFLDAVAEAAPGRPALRDSAGEGWTYGEYARVVSGYAAWLTEQGVRHGDRVLVRLPNTRDMVALLFAVTRLGAVFVPVNPAMKDYHLVSVVGDCEPVLVVADDRAVTAVQKLTDVPVRAVGAAREAAQARPADAPPVPNAAAPGDVAVLIYTSGSTAAPKGVVCPHAQMVFAASSVGQVLGYRGDDVVFCRLPLPFDYGLYQVLLACRVGAELFLSGSEPDYTLLERIVESGATIVPLVPALASMVSWLAEREPTPTKVRMFTSTGAALPQSTIDTLRTHFSDAAVVRMYGITECKRVTVMPPDEELERPGSVGPAIPGTTVTIMAEDGTVLPPGEIGEITVTGPHVMAGYWNAPEVTARTYRTDPATGETRLHTGDWGSMDADGYVYFDGRRDDLFKRNGVRMSTIEIEAAAMDVPGIRAACVLLPTDTRDLVICVSGDVRPGFVLRELAKRLETAKVPATCHVIEDFPLTANGKNARKVLLELIDGTAK